MSAAIHLQQLRFAWPGHSNILNIPQLQIQAGERVFIQGASGSGKSTLLGILAGIQLASSGSVTVLGQDLAQLSASRRDRFRADHMGYIFQQFNLLPFLSVLENVTAALTFSPHKHSRLKAAPQIEAARLLEELQLPSHILAKPVHQLSIGQQQRVAAARALIGSPALVIADEPTSALDSDNREAFIRLLFTECERVGSTLLFVSHDRGLQPLFPRCIDLPTLNHQEATLC